MFNTHHPSYVSIQIPICKKQSNTKTTKSIKHCFHHCNYCYSSALVISFWYILPSPSLKTITHTSSSIPVLFLFVLCEDLCDLVGKILLFFSFFFHSFRLPLITELFVPLLVWSVFYLPLCH